jgi:hypothetical protein
MSEVLGGISFGLGIVNIILSTIPTGVKVAHTNQNRPGHIQSLQARLVDCEMLFNALTSRWKSLNPSDKDKIFASSLETIRVLRTRIDDAITKHVIKHSPGHPNQGNAIGAWRKMKKRLEIGIFRKPRAQSSKFWIATTYALWEKDIVDGWITDLEKTLDVIDKLLDKDFHSRTAHQFSGKPSRWQEAELKQLESFVENLWDLAGGLYNDCTNAANTSGWALGLQSPAYGNDVANLRLGQPVNIQFRFSAVKLAEDERHFRLDVRYQHDNPATPTPVGVSKLVQEYVLNSGESTTSLANVHCSLQDPLPRRTHSLGHLLQQQPDIFRDKYWIKDRGDIIYGISNWALLLSQTPWLENLCCYGIVVEQSLTPTNHTRPIFDGPLLKNLGLVLVQLLLGKTIRPTSNSNDSEYEQHENGKWTTVYLSQTIEEIGATTFSLELQNAIKSCFQAGTFLPNGRFAPGYLYRCIEEIFKPLVLHPSSLTF